MQMIKQCFFLLILASAALFMPHAKAACTTPDMPKMINVASVSVPTTLAIGETIPEQSKPYTLPDSAIKVLIAVWKLSPAITEQALRYQA